MSHIIDQLNTCTNNKERKIMLKEIRKYIEKDSRRYPEDKLILVGIPEHLENKKGLLKIYRSRDFLVQVYEEKHAVVRVSMSRSTIKDNGHWEEGITWNQLMWAKREVGYGDYDAVEVYPKDEDVVDVANIRHLFVIDKPLEFIWRNFEDDGKETDRRAAKGSSGEGACSVEENRSV